MLGFRWGFSFPTSKSSSRWHERCLDVAMRPHGDSDKTATCGRRAVLVINLVCVLAKTKHTQSQDVHNLRMRHDAQHMMLACVGKCRKSAQLTIVRCRVCEVMLERCRIWASFDQNCGKMDVFGPIWDFGLQKTCVFCQNCCFFSGWESGRENSSLGGEFWP